MCVFEITQLQKLIAELKSAAAKETAMAMLSIMAPRAIATIPKFTRAKYCN